MSRKLSLSQAARMLGLTRQDIQEQVQLENLKVFEGTVTLDDLKIAFPDHQYEDNTMVERMQKNISDAVHKMVQNEHDGIQIEALSKRAYMLNRELSIQKSRADYYEELINRLKHRFIEISTSSKSKSEFIELQQWLHDETTDVNLNIDLNSNEIMEKQIDQFMQPHVRLLPSRHDYLSDKSETLLESALHAGLAVDYGCNNGNCGKCKVKLISGHVEKVKNTDYVLSAEEKQNNYILSCAHRAVTDIVLESKEAVSIDDIPLQKITTKLKTYEVINNKMIVLSLKTPRSQRLRFMAGQEMKISIQADNDEVLKTQLPIASCPCDDMNIQFHFPFAKDNPVFNYLSANSSKNQEIVIEGPDGSFILNEDSPNTLIFIAVETNFARIKSLIEHALAIDLAEHIHVYWVVQDESMLYMKNLCRSWDDALDNFHFYPIITNKNCEHNIGEISKNIVKRIKSHDHLNNFDFYMSASKPMMTSLKKELLENAVPESNIYC
ncbi:MAG: 2Fe-2S iron-sulfur cluster binding domain-containing protein [Gammaproteobacteria bacterium]|nr:2Fe-2S iron-sulfur cluster binding domain-containing protein [Gammaproteobacteria bacterium]